MTKKEGKHGVVEFVYFHGGPSDSSLCLTVIKLGLALGDAMSFFFQLFIGILQTATYPQAISRRPNPSYSDFM